MLNQAVSSDRLPRSCGVMGTKVTSRVVSVAHWSGSVMLRCRSVKITRRSGALTGSGERSSHARDDLGTTDEPEAGHDLRGRVQRILLPQEQLLPAFKGAVHDLEPVLGSYVEITSLAMARAWSNSRPFAFSPSILKLLSMYRAMVRAPSAGPGSLLADRASQRPARERPVPRNGQQQYRQVPQLPPGSGNARTGPEQVNVGKVQALKRRNWKRWMRMGMAEPSMPRGSRESQRPWPPKVGPGNGRMPPVIGRLVVLRDRDPSAFYVGWSIVWCNRSRWLAVEGLQIPLRHAIISRSSDLGFRSGPAQLRLCPVRAVGLAVRGRSVVPGGGGPGPGW